MLNAVIGYNFIFILRTRVGSDKLI